MLAVLCLAGGLSVTMVVCLYPEIVNLSVEFRQPVSAVAWSMIIVTVVGTGVGAVAAGLGAVIGNRLMLLVLMGGVLVGGLIVVFSHSLTPLIIGRGIQGIGMGSLSLCVGIVANFWSGQKMRRAIGTVMTSVGVGALVGYLLGGFIWKSGGDWRTMFWVIVGLAALALVLIVLFVKETKRIRGVPIDYLGAAGLLAWTALILVPLSQAGSWGWGSAKALELLVPGVILAVSWVVWELRRPAPLLDLRILARMGVWPGALLWFSIAMGLYSSSTFIPYLLQTPHAFGGYGFGKDLFVVSLALSLPGLMIVLMSPLTPWFMRVIGRKGTMLFGAALGLAGFGVAAAHQSIWVNIVWLGVFGAAFALGGTAAYAVATEAVTPQQGVVASGLLTTSTTLGASVATSLTGYILTLRTVSFAAPGAAAPVTVPAAQTFTWVGIAVGIVAALSVVAVLTIDPKKFHVADREV